MTAAEFDDFDVDDSCPNCDGSGWVDSCFEDTCVCLDPPCHQNRCDWCNHQGSKARMLTVEERPAAPAGPLLEIMMGSDPSPLTAERAPGAEDGTCRPPGGDA